jgi:hypothetical protein
LYISRGAVQLSHTVLARNTAASGADVLRPEDSQLDAQFSWIGDGRGADLIETGAGAPDANGNLIGGPVHGPIDPRLGPLAANGGSTLTHMPLPGSPVIGAGDPAFVPGVNGAPEFDQRGAPFTRLAGARIDIGAVEVQAVDGAFGADFNFDGVVDGNDFLLWQRNVGRTSGATLRQGDATADGDVDGNDLAVWKARAAQQGARSEEPGARGEETGARSAELGTMREVVGGQGAVASRFVSLAQRATEPWRPASRATFEVSPQRVVVEVVAESKPGARPAPARHVPAADAVFASPGEFELEVEALALDPEAAALNAALAGL